MFVQSGGMEIRLRSVLLLPRRPDSEVVVVIPDVFNNVYQLQVTTDLYS